jgi:hypothetical protein
MLGFWRRCQSEFEKDYMEGLNKEKYQAQMVDPTLSEADKKKLKVNNLSSTVLFLMQWSGSVGFWVIFGRAYIQLKEQSKNFFGKLRSCRTE